MDNIKEDLRTKNLDIRTVTDLIRDRTRCKPIVSLADGRERRRMK